MSHDWRSVEVPVTFDLRKEEAVMKLQLDEARQLPRSDKTSRFLNAADQVTQST